MTTPDTDINKLETDYDNLRRLLLSAPHQIDTVAEMLELIKLSTRIRPPYHKRTVALVKILRFLNEESSRTQVGPMQRYVLKGYWSLLCLKNALIIPLCISVLQRSIRVLKDTETNTTTEHQDHEEAFRAHLARVEACSKTLGVRFF